MLPGSVLFRLFFIRPPHRYEVNRLDKSFGNILIIALVTIPNCFGWLKIFVASQLKKNKKIKKLKTRNAKQLFNMEKQI